MNLIRLGKLIIENYFFMRSLTHKLGEPVHHTDEECHTIIEGLKADKMMSQKFAFVYNIKAAQLSHHFNTEVFLSYNGYLDLNKFFLFIHPDFMEDYLNWGKAVYSYLMKQQHTKIEPLKQCTRITVPLKLIDGQYHWVLQEALPLQIDANNNLVSHLNIYSVLKPMKKDDKEEMSQRLYDKGMEATEWTKVVWKEFFTRESFSLTPEQRRIVEVLHKNIELTNLEVAQVLGKTKNTIDMQNKQIKARAKASFSHQEFDNIKDIVRFLRQIGYFED